MSVFSSEEQSNVFHVGLGFCSSFMLHLYAFLFMCMLGTTEKAAYIPFWVMWQEKREGLIMEPSQHSKSMSICFFHKDALQYYFSPEIFFPLVTLTLDPLHFFLTRSSFCWLLPPWKIWFISLTFLLTSWQIFRLPRSFVQFLSNILLGWKDKKRDKSMNPKFKRFFLKRPLMF